VRRWTLFGAVERDECNRLSGRLGRRWGTQAVGRWACGDSEAGWWWEAREARDGATGVDRDSGGARAMVWGRGVEGGGRRAEGGGGGDAGVCGRMDGRRSTEPQWTATRRL
jgi:hypothetical protein